MLMWTLNYSSFVAREGAQHVRAIQLHRASNSLITAALRFLQEDEHGDCKGAASNNAHGNPRGLDLELRLWSSYSPSKVSWIFIRQGGWLQHLRHVCVWERSCATHAFEKKKRGWLCGLVRNIWSTDQQVVVILFPSVRFGLLCCVLLCNVAMRKRGITRIEIRNRASTVGKNVCVWRLAELKQTSYSKGNEVHLSES